MPDNLEVQMRELILSKQALVFTCLHYKSFENTVGKGEIARNEQFLLFPQFFFYLPAKLSAIVIKSKIIIWKLFQFGKRSTLYFTKMCFNDPDKEGF